MNSRIIITYSDIFLLVTFLSIALAVLILQKQPTYGETKKGVYVRLVLEHDRLIARIYSPYTILAEEKNGQCFELISTNGKILNPYGSRLDSLYSLKPLFEREHVVCHQFLCQQSSAKSSAYLEKELATGICARITFLQGYQGQTNIVATSNMLKIDNAVLTTRPDKLEPVVYEKDVTNYTR